MRSLYFTALAIGNINGLVSQYYFYFYMHGRLHNKRIWPINVDKTQPAEGTLASYAEVVVFSMRLSFYPSLSEV